MTAADALMWTAVVMVVLGIVSMIIKSESSRNEINILWRVLNLVLVLGGAALLIASFWGRIQ